VTISTERLDLAQRESDLWVAVDVEEVRRQQMSVPRGLRGVDALDLHDPVAAHVTRDRIDLQPSLEVTEAALDGCDHEMLDRELDGRVSGVNGPEACGCDRMRGRCLG
jgi:hypothetical protein